MALKAWKTFVDRCRAYNDVTSLFPDEANAEKVEASLTTDEQRARRAELVHAFHLAIQLEKEKASEQRQGSGQSSQKCENDDRLTVRLRIDEQYLLRPEMQALAIKRALVMLVRPGLACLLYLDVLESTNKNAQYSFRNASIVQGMQILYQKAGSLVVKIQSEEEVELATQRARERGFYLKVLASK